MALRWRLGRACRWVSVEGRGWVHSKIKNLGMAWCVGCRWGGKRKRQSQFNVRPHPALSPEARVKFERLSQDLRSGFRRRVQGFRTLGLCRGKDGQRGFFEFWELSRVGAMRGIRLRSAQSKERAVGPLTFEFLSPSSFPGRGWSRADPAWMFIRASSIKFRRTRSPEQEVVEAGRGGGGLVGFYQGILATVERGGFAGVGGPGFSQVESMFFPSMA